MALYKFPGALPPGCSGSAGVYTCTALNLQDHVQFNDVGNVTITVNGDLTFGGYTFGNATDSANVTFKANGNVYISFPTIYANIDAGIYSINISASPTIFGNLTTTSGYISAKGTISGNVNSTTGYVALNDKTSVGGNVSSTTGYIYDYNNSTVSGAISSTSGNIYMYGNNTASSTVSCTTCQLTVYNGGNLIVGAISVGILDDIAGSVLSAGTIYNSTITTLTGDANIGYYATVTGNISAYNSVVIRDHASVTGNIKSNNDAQIRYYATVTGSITTSTTGSTTVDILDYATVNGNISATGTSSGSVAYVHYYYNTTINGSLTTNTPYASYIYVYSTSTVNGDITGYGGSLLSDVEIWGTVTGNVKSTSAVLANGDVYLWYGTTKVNGSLYVSGDIYNYGTVTGCAQTYNTAAGQNVYLYFGSSTNATCSGSSSCSTNTNYVYTGLFVSMPPLCTFGGTKIANYAMDEASWNGTINETKDTAGYTGGPFNGQGTGTPIPTAENTSPAIAGTSGTCGYATLSGSTNGGSAFTLDGLPVSTANGAKTSVSFWMYWDGTQTGQIAIGWNTYVIGFVGNSFGFDTNNNYDIYGVNGATFKNSWVHVVAVFTNGSVSSNSLYINGVKQTLTQLNSAYTNTGATVQSTLNIGGRSLDNNFRFIGGRIDEVKVYNGEVTQSQVTADYTATHTCPVYSIIPANFNCTIVGGSSSTGHLYTQVAGSSFNIDVKALKSTGAVETSYVSSGTKNVTLEFVDGSGATACASRAVLTPQISQTVTFSATDAGRKTVSNLSIAKAYRDLRCRVTDANQSPSVVGCSTDDFAVRPTSFTVSTSNANADLTSGASTLASPVIKTGASFSLTANTGVLGYDGTPSVDTTKLNAHTGAIQIGSLTGAFSAAIGTTGSATGVSFNYSEVGYFNFAANGIYDSTFTAVDSANGDCATGFTGSGGKYACSFGNAATTSYFGRFIPDHFSLSTGSTTPACSTSAVSSERFTYLGQDGFSTSFSLVAQNSSNQTTQNYTGSFAKFALNAWTNYTFKANGLPTGTTLTASSVGPTGTWTNGTAAVVAKHIVTRPSSPVAGGNISISTTPADSDGVTMPLTYVSSSSLFRYGRLWVPNAYGSELLPLSVPIEAQYWNGTTYQRNQLDVCTTISPSNISMSNYKSNLGACETQLSGTSTMVKGLTKAKLSAPGNGNNGSVDLTLNLANVAASPNNKTCTSSTESTATATGYSWFGNANPSARETFGIYKTPVIYLRENFY